MNGLSKLIVTPALVSMLTFDPSGPSPPTTFQSKH
ncbi:hypothetical protein NC651_022298 [Populus alba x Populus x berolinensis]|nr:hypothetical protein NC651_022298 [Populus alba x Populus x berolinensis]